MSLIPMKIDKNVKNLARFQLRHIFSLKTFTYEISFPGVLLFSGSSYRIKSIIKLKSSQNFSIFGEHLSCRLIRRDFAGCARAQFRSERSERGLFEHGRCPKI